MDEAPIRYDRFVTADPRMIVFPEETAPARLSLSDLFYFPPEDVPENPIAESGDEYSPEPLVRFPAAEAAARSLLERRAMTRAEFDGLTLDARRAAFTVARVSSLDALEKIQRALADDALTGGTLAEFRTAVHEAVQTSALADAHLETVWRTNLAAAETSGLMRVLSDPMVADEFPYLEYHAVHDARVRPEHLAMETLGIQGTNIYRRDDPIWELFLPPWDYNCRCAIVPLSLEDAAAKGIREAQEWLRAGIPPARPAWVKQPDFAPPAGWTRNLIGAIV